ncbi:LysR substrate-binding domain-containing protein [Caballeronia insecticola]|uniref:Transcriptional regulator LysR family n=1 Tax=Caballeronia insecticola TaxID=758793 RepID=A0A060PQV0_9BURK|nr:LysR substrate-binding domain-containing protein [Caballeronia insecticola]BAO94039.1 transcriptional regulator LysR family [Caballeronia insecticola]
MTLQQLRDFTAIVAHGGVRAAARELGVSQAGLTKSVARLEEATQAELFLRTSRGITLTAVGETLLQHALAILRECDRAESSLIQLRGDLAGKVELGVSPVASLHLLPAVTAEFLRRYPLGQLSVVQGMSHSLVPMIRSGHLDVAVSSLPDAFDTTGLNTIPLFPTEPVVVGRKSHPLANSRSVNDLLDCHWMESGMTDRFGAPGSSVGAMFSEAGFGKPRIAVVCDSLSDTILLVTKSDLLSVLPAAIFTQNFLQSGLVVLPIERPLKTFPTAVIHRATPPLSPLAVSLVGMLVSYAKIRTKVGSLPANKS